MRKKSPAPQTPNTDAAISPEAIEQIAGLFKLLSDPTRLRIVQAVCTGEQSVGTIVKMVKAGQANVSKHLALLAAKGVVSRRREGLNVYYVISEPLILALCRTVKASLNINKALASPCPLLSSRLAGSER